MGQENRAFSRGLELQTRSMFLPHRASAAEGERAPNI